MIARPIEIVGGGLAGLSLGFALQKAGVRTTVFEAGTYPRHRVCGEFIAGLKPATIHALGLEAILAGARPLSEVAWFSQGRVVRKQSLLRPALALSRWALDDRLAQAYIDAGGDLQTQHRIEDSTTPAGRIFAMGRRRGPSPWLGLKLHARGLRLESDLEFHLGNSAYVGLSAVENGDVNICGLFRRRSHLELDREHALLAYLREANLGSIAARLDRAEIDPQSFSAVAGFTFSRPPHQHDRISLGDHFSMIPPYTGNGMAIAFQTAECALEPLRRWSRGEKEWPETVGDVMQSIRQRLERRLFIASRLHNFMLSPLSQKIFQLANLSRLLPLRRLAAVVHA